MTTLSSGPSVPGSRFLFNRGTPGEAADPPPSAGLHQVETSVHRWRGGRHDPKGRGGGSHHDSCCLCHRRAGPLLTAEQGRYAPAAPWTWLMSKRKRPPGSRAEAEAGVGTVAGMAGRCGRRGVCSAAARSPLLWARPALMEQDCVYGGRESVSNGRASVSPALGCQGSAAV